MTNVEAAENNTFHLARTSDARPRTRALTTLNDRPSRRSPIDNPPIGTVPIQCIPDTIEPNNAALQTNPPIAIGLLRRTASGRAATLHALALPHHARALGYRYVYTVRPPEDATDPIGYALTMAAKLPAAAIIVYDLTAVDGHLARICESFDLETVCPPATWSRSAARASTEYRQFTP